MGTNVQGKQPQSKQERKVDGEGGREGGRELEEAGISLSGRQ